MPFGLRTKQKARIVLVIRGPQTLAQQKAFKKRLQALLRKYRGKIVAPPRRDG